MKFPIELLFDCRESPDSVIEEIAPILLSAGVYVYNNPVTWGEDEQVYIFTKKKMNRKDMVKYIKRLPGSSGKFFKDMAKDNGNTLDEEADEWVERCFGGDPKPIA